MLRYVSVYQNSTRQTSRETC